MAGKSRYLELDGVCYSKSTIRKQSHEYTLLFSSPFHLYSTDTSIGKWCFLPTLINQTKMITYWHAKRSISQVVLDPVKQTVNTNSYNYVLRTG